MNTIHDLRERVRLPDTESDEQVIHLAVAALDSRQREIELRAEQLRRIEKVLRATTIEGV
jgi:hypothetical protein